MKKTTYICDICGEHYNYITNQSVSILINSYVVKQLGDVCDNCMGHLKNDVTAAIETMIRETKSEIRRKETYPDYEIDENNKHKMAMEDKLEDSSY